MAAPNIETIKLKLEVENQGAFKKVTAAFKDLTTKIKNFEFFKQLSSDRYLFMNHLNSKVNLRPFRSVLEESCVE